MHRNRFLGVVLLSFLILVQPSGAALARGESPAADATTGAGQGAQVLGPGTHILDAAQLASISSLEISKEATAVVDVARASDLVLPGNLSNHGQLYFGSSSSGSTAANLTAANILNGKGALISTALPADAIPGFTNAVSALDLNLTALSDIVNAGRIVSSANLNLTAGGQIVNQATISAVQNVNLASAIGSIVNSGTITSQAANINIAAQTAQNITMNSLNGTLQAMAGSINVRDAAYTGAEDINITGGSFLARQINLFGGTGRVEAQLEEVIGALQVTADFANVGAATPELTLGAIKVDGDPVFYNSAGSITITDNITVSEKLAILASGNVTTTSDVAEITARDGSGQGYDIVIAAGANLSSSGGDTTTTVPGTQAAGNVTLLASSPSATGGNIDFTDSPRVAINASSTCNDCSGAEITLAAFASANTAIDTGHIVLPPDSELNTSGSGNGGNQSIFLIAGARSGTAIKTGKLIAEGGNPNSGIVHVSASQPRSSDDNDIVFAANGEITSGNQLVPSTVNPQAGILLGNDILSGVAVFLDAGSDIMSSPGVLGPKIPVGALPLAVAINPSNTRVYVSNAQDSTISVIDTASNLVVKTFHLASSSFPVGLAISSDGSTLYSVDRNGRVVRVIDANTGDLKLKTKPFGVGLSNLSVSRDGKDLFVVSSGEAKVYRVGVSKKFTIVGKSVIVGLSPTGIATSPSQNQLLVANGSGTVSILSEQLGIVGTAAAGSNPTGVVYSPDGRRAYVTNEGSANVTVLEGTIPRAVASIPVGEGPTALSLSPDGHLLYVVNGDSGTTSIIDTSTLKVIDTVAAGERVHGLVGLGNFVGTVNNMPTAYIAESTFGDQHFVQVLRPAVISTRLLQVEAGGEVEVYTDVDRFKSTGSPREVVVHDQGAIEIQESLARDLFRVTANGSVTVTGPIETQRTIELESLGLPSDVLDIQADLDTGDRNDGRINLVSSGLIKVHQDATVITHGGSGVGVVLFQTSPLGGNLVVENDGLIVANNGLGDLGIIGFNAGDRGGISVLNTSPNKGILRGRTSVNFGFLNPNTLEPQKYSKPNPNFELRQSSVGEEVRISKGLGKGLLQKELKEDVKLASLVPSPGSPPRLIKGRHFRGLTGILPVDIVTTTAPILPGPALLADETEPSGTGESLLRKARRPAERDEEGEEPSAAGKNGCSFTLGDTAFSVDTLMPIAYRPSVAPPARFYLESSGDGKDRSKHDRLAHFIVDGAARAETLSATAAPDGSGGTVPPVVTLESGSMFLNTLRPIQIKTDFADVSIQPQALVSLSRVGGLLRVIALSGPGHVTVYAAGRKAEVAPGSELVVADHQLVDEERHPSDGIGRRRLHLHKLTDSLYVLHSDISVVSMLSNSPCMSPLRYPPTAKERRMADKVMKTAAILHHLTASRGAYKARPALRTQPGPASDYTPVNHRAAGSRTVGVQL